ncbi:nicotinate-nucleotide adenylyltransferase [Thermoactinomyces intermedius]|jgi:nicotinate-nucleotide adenylyltransferase|uniref:Probable nicotinate-nucleotide adenylyltransferase n=1 Tax=Thermoactinomyces intermedius TaxID=2024 RepID=A0A8I1AAU9_THEIN|nr:nicotinate-nucleotide adenylyltransferase [Thermoactinomyces intermedius]MBA4547792.1 nicotinate-nucleotide adenylyltransferase [Thermoactinomyces intermedius]MBA4836597.1 nicotinate-nucleotide adenylyltransferase [Thermoactinomyces intermedius]MBH8593979.1 nicotinate-nucleotide adenylyltransferase [Thermoactinomyces intermedius]
MKVGIFGGTFDPVHFGHLLLAEQAREAASLHEIWFIPAGEPPHKQGKPLTPAEERKKMVELAVEGHPQFKVNPIELLRSGPSYTVDTIMELRKQNPHVEFFLLVGADMVKNLPKWYKIKEIIQNVHVIGLGRPGVDHDALPEFIEERLMWIPDAVETNISSSIIRKRLMLNRSVRYLVPDSVYKYIKEQGLYGS